MDTVKILRELTRHRLLLSAACLLALLVGAAVLYTPSLPPKSRDYTVGVASASILLDTPSSQVVDVAPRGSDTLGNRANLLASLMVDGDVKNTIAHDAGINPPTISLATHLRSRTRPRPPPRRVRRRSSPLKSSPTTAAHSSRSSRSKPRRPPPPPPRPSRLPPSPDCVTTSTPPRPGNASPMLSASRSRASAPTRRPPPPAGRARCSRSPPRCSRSPSSALPSSRSHA